MADEQTRRACRNILCYELKAKAREKLVLIFDSDKERIAEAFVHEASRLGVTPHRLVFPSLEEGSGLPSSLQAEVNEAIGRGLLIVLMSPAMLRSVGFNKWGELIGFPSKPSSSRLFSDWVLPKESFARIYGVDWLETAEYRDTLLRRLSGVKVIEVTTEAGTEVSLEPRSWIGAASAGSFGSVSEVFTAPVEEPVSGVIVYDASIYYAKPRKPIRLRVERGRIIEVDGPEDDEQLEILKDTRRDEGASVIAELGLGSNPDADPFGHIMEAERARGTCHFGFGDNTRFGGTNRSASHVDGVCFKPTLLGDSRPILQRGFLSP